MSKRCRVRCNCLNRRLLTGSDTVYACGHPSGDLIEFFAGKLLVVGLDVLDVFSSEPDKFPTFKNLTNWCIHNEGSMCLSPSEAGAWLEEIRELRKYDSGELEMGDKQRESWRELREGEVLRYAGFDDELPTVFERLLDAEALCKASIRTGNPIEFY